MATANEPGVGVGHGCGARKIPEHRAIVSAPTIRSVASMRLTITVASGWPQLDRTPTDGTAIHWHGRYRPRPAMGVVMRWYLRHFMQETASGLAACARQQSAGSVQAADPVLKIGQQTSVRHAFSSAVSWRPTR